MKISHNKILVFNAGSSSLRFKLFEKKGGSLVSLHEGHFDNHGKPIKDFEEAVKKAVQDLKNHGAISTITDVAKIGHRVVHGGETYTKPVIITPAVLKKIRALGKLAPLHNPPNLACILAAQKLFKHAKHVAVFDTAFHQTMPEKAYLYALPYSLYKKQGVRRYGFHGTSHEYVFQEARKKLGAKKTRRTVTCHLGNGCSMAAILNGRVVDTSMGFTPLEGLPMGTRSGDVDPAIIFYLMEEGMSGLPSGMHARQVEQMLQKKSGLLGLSEFSGDVRDLWAAFNGKNGAAKKIAAKRTCDFFAYRIAKYIGAYTVALGGLDCIVFTGGTGENAWYLRKWIMNYVRKIVQAKVLVIKTDEEREIAMETKKLIIG